jgi:hypothetical protein
MSTSQEVIRNTYHDLIVQGAEDVHTTFSIAREGQYDIVHNDKRYLLTENGEQYQQYANTMEAAHIDYFQVAPELTIPEGVAAVEIPRDVRNLAQVSQSVGDPEARTIAPEAIFKEFGSVIKAIEKAVQKLPDERSLDLRSAVYSRENNTVMLSPSIMMQESSQAQKNRLVNAVHQQLQKVRAFRETELFSAFLDGME